MSNWNGLDFFIFLIFALNTIIGFSRGASRELIAMMCLSAALIFTIVFTLPLATFLNSSPLVTDVVTNIFIIRFMDAIGAGPLTPGLLASLMYCISLLICFVGTYSICGAGLSATGFTEYLSFAYATMSRKLGGALGCTRGFILSVIFVSLLVHVYSNNDVPGRGMVDQSYFANLLLPSAATLEGLIKSRQPDNYNQLFQGKDLFNVGDVVGILRSQN